MIRAFLTGAFALALFCGSGARAQVPVIDSAALGKFVVQIGVLEKQLQEAIQTYQQVLAIYGAVSGMANAGGWAGILNQSSMQNPLPFSSTQFPGIVAGLTNPSGLPFGSMYLSQNTVGGSLTPYQNGSFVGQQIIAAIQTIAGIQATATNNLQSLEFRLAALPDIQVQLNSATTVQQTTAIAARMDGEQNFVSSQQAQATNMLGAAEMQLKAIEMNMRQYEFQDEANGIQTMCGQLSSSTGNGGITVTMPECQTTGQ